MATMNISLPDQMKEWVEGQSQTGRFANSSDYIRDLIRTEQERLEYIAYIQKAVDDGYASGISERKIEDIFAQVRGEVSEEVAS